MTRICFLNPFGTDLYDELIAATLTPALHDSSQVDIRHLAHAPKNIDNFAAKHLGEVEIMRAAIEAEDEGYDAFVIGCCYDPGLTQCRELVDIPVIGPLEASVLLARLFGQYFAVVTDHHKAATEMRDLVRRYGLESSCRAVDAIDWHITDIADDPLRAAKDTHAKVRQVMADTGAETIVLGCTIVAASYELAVMEGDEDLAGLSIINPNVMAVKAAEMFADLRATRQYRISRTGYYGQHTTFDPDDPALVRSMLSGRPAMTAHRTADGGGPASR